MSQRYSPYITLARSSQKSLMKSRTPEHLPSPPHSPPPSGIDADAMAQQTIAYMNVLSEHSAAIRACPRPDVYQRVIDQGRVQPRKASWPSLDDCGRDDLRRRMEEIINRTATSAEDHLEICSAAHTLLLLQHDILSRMPYAESRKIDEKTNVLRAARRQQLSRQRLGGRFRGLAAPPPLPPVETPGPPAKFFRITPSLLEALLNVPKPPILNQKFRISEPSSEVDTVYQIRSVEISSDGLRFGMQTEGSSHADPINEDELKGILEYSIGVSSE